MDVVVELLTYLLAGVVGWATSRVRVRVRRALPEQRIYNDTRGHVIASCMHGRAEVVASWEDTCDGAGVDRIRWCPECGALHCGGEWREPPETLS